jgi:threonine dehydrogenase-like Zn-dependent dehydrogenase
MVAPSHPSSVATLKGADAGPWKVSSLGFAAPYQTAFFDYEEADLPEGRFRVRTLYTGLSAGTELTHFRGTNQYLHKTWDDALKLFRAGAASQRYPLMFSGYMEVGRVSASRYEAIEEGQVVAMSYGHKTGHTVDPLGDLFVPLPPGLDPILGVYVAQMGPICANAILHADDEARHESSDRFGCGVADQRILVFGSGVIALLTALMARWAGAAEVAIADAGAGRLATARALGFLTVDVAETDPAIWAKERWASGAGDRGADLAFQCRASDQLLAHALDALRPQASLIDLAFYQGGAPALRLGEAFHHSGLRHISAQISRVPRRLRHRWNRARLSRQLRFLQDCGDDVRRHLITDVVPLAAAQRVFDEIASRRRQPLQVVFSLDPGLNPGLDRVEDRVEDRAGVPAYASGAMP